MSLIEVSAFLNEPLAQDPNIGLKLEIAVRVETCWRCRREILPGEYIDRFSIGQEAYARHHEGKCPKF